MGKVFGISSFEKIEGHFSFPSVNPSVHQHDEGLLRKKGVSSLVFLKPQFSLSRQIIKIKRNQLDPIGSAKVLPFWNKGFLRKKKASPRSYFVNLKFSLSRQVIKINRNQLDPIANAKALPFGG